MVGKRKATASEDVDVPKKSAKTEGALVHPDRVRSLKEGDVKPGPVIYWYVISRAFLTQKCMLLA